MKIYFTNLKPHLNHTLASIYYLGGQPEALRIDAIKLIRSANKKHGYDKNTFFIDKNFDWAPIYNAAQNNSLFADKTLIELFFIDDINSAHKENIKSLLTTIATSKNINCLISSTATPDNKIIVKSIINDVITIPIYPLNNYALVNWIKNKSNLLGLKIAANYITALATEYADDMEALKQALIRLKYQDTSEATTTNLDFTKCSTSNNMLYDLMNNIILQKPSKSLWVLENLINQNIPVMLIFWSLNKHVCLLNKFCTMKFDHTPATVAMNLCKIPQFKQDLYIKIYNDFPYQLLPSIIKKSYDLEKSLKGLNHHCALILLESIIVLVSKLNE